MGGIFSCLDEGDPNASFGIEQKANIAGDQIKKTNYTGTLYELIMVETTSKDPKSFDFKDPIGKYKQFHQGARIVQGKESQAKFTPAGGKITLMPDFSFEFTFYAVDSLFFSDTTSFNAVLEFEESTPADLNRIATIIVSTQRGKDNFVPVYDNIPIYGHSKGFNIPLRPEDLVMNKRGANKGSSVIRLSYAAGSGTKTLKIKQITIMTQSGVDAKVCDKNILMCSKDYEKYVCLAGQEYEGDNKKAIGNENPISEISEPVLAEGNTNYEDQLDYFMYGNSGMDLKLDTRVYLNPALLALLVRDHTLKLTLKIKMKASDGNFGFIWNDKMEKDQVQVGSADTEILLELTWKEVAINNIMTIKTANPTNFMGIKSITLDITL